jgi:hypothetical protein
LQTYLTPESLGLLALGCCFFSHLIFRGTGIIVDLGGQHPVIEEIISDQLIATFSFFYFLLFLPTSVGR